MLPGDHRSPTTDNPARDELHTRGTPSNIGGLIALVVLVVAIVAVIVIATAGGDPSGGVAPTTVPDGLPLE